MKICVDHGKCTGLGICESLAPDYFEVDDAGDLVLLKQDIEPADLQALQEAVDGCPTEAIHLED